MTDTPSPVPSKAPSKKALEKATELVWEYLGPVTDARSPASSLLWAIGYALDRFAAEAVREAAREKETHMDCYQYGERP
jgi:hypothetical protein